jgi:hypothetical protein
LVIVGKFCLGCCFLVFMGSSGMGFFDEQNKLQLAYPI